MKQKIIISEDGTCLTIEPPYEIKETIDMKHFYDTVPQSPQELQEANSRAISQEDRIYQFMKNTDMGPMWTAWQLLDWMDYKMEITSIRRALFNLEKQGKIVQQGFVKGPKGKPVGRYLAWSGKLF